MTYPDALAPRKKEMNFKPTVRIDFSDFAGINKTDNFFTSVLSRRYRIELSDKPDLLIYSKDGHLNRLYNCKKLFWSGETIYPDFTRCDYALTCYYIDDPRHLRLPYYVIGCECSPESLLKFPNEVDRVLHENRKFCSFVVSNGNPKRARRRIDFFHKLSEYKRIDSGGRALNNIGMQLSPGGHAKHDFIKNYKFNLCFENKETLGYTTEKLVEAAWARCVPIYWGNPLVARDFNPKSFLCLNDFASEEAFIEKIIEVDQDESQYRALLSEPFFNDNKINEFYSHERLLDFFEKVFDDQTTPVSKRRKLINTGRWRLAKMMN